MIDLIYHLLLMKLSLRKSFAIIYYGKNKLDSSSQKRNITFPWNNSNRDRNNWNFSADTSNNNFSNTCLNLFYEKLKADERLASEPQIPRSVHKNLS